jgi:hypothetical protein
VFEWRKKCLIIFDNLRSFLASFKQVWTIFNHFGSVFDHFWQILKHFQPIFNLFSIGLDHSQTGFELSSNHFQLLTLTFNHFWQVVNYFQLIFKVFSINLDQSQPVFDHFHQFLIVFDLSSTNIQPLLINFRFQPVFNHFQTTFAQNFYEFFDNFRPRLVLYHFDKFSNIFNLVSTIFPLVLDQFSTRYQFFTSFWPIFDWPFLANSLTIFNQFSIILNEYFWPFSTISYHL